MNRFTHTKAFTLAEVLITLMVIGILAMVTIPSLMQSWEERATVSRLKQAYSSLQQAYQSTELEYGNVYQWGNGSTVTLKQQFGDKFTEFLPVIKSCKFTASGCFPNLDYQYLNKNPPPNSNLEEGNHLYKILLKDGACVAIYSWTCNNDGCGVIFYDINGHKPPNTYGKDLFMFHIQKRILPTGGAIGGSDTVSGYAHNTTCSYIDKSGTACARWVIERGNMDYLHKVTTW